MIIFHVKVSTLSDESTTVTAPTLVPLAAARPLLRRNAPSFHMLPPLLLLGDWFFSSWMLCRATCKETHVRRPSCPGFVAGGCVTVSPKNVSAAAGYLWWRLIFWKCAASVSSPAPGGDTCCRRWHVLQRILFSKRAALDPQRSTLASWMI